MRVEDIDPEREQSGAGSSIVESLAAHGLHSSQTVQWQSQHSDHYDQALSQLARRELIYACRCNAKARKLYRQQPCPCREQNLPFNCGQSSWRLRVAAPSQIEFHDRNFGLIQQNIATEVGDFVLQRRDGHYAYQLAVVVDDARAGISHIVRGQDLLAVTPRQIYLQRVLGVPTPSYLHIPLVHNSAGQKLSKQNQAPALENSQALSNLQQACRHLHLHHAQRASTIAQLLDTATSEWQHQ